MFSVPLVVALLIAFAITQVANLVTTLYLHRALSHKAMTIGKPLELVMRTVLWLSMGIERREWVAVHRKHHVFSDEAQDPHSPIQKGVWKVTFGNVVYYRREAKRADTIQTYARDLEPDRIEKLLFSKGLLGVGLSIVALVVLFGPLTAAVIAVTHTVLYILLGGCVNGLGHWFGKRPHENKATNQRWLAMLTAGEGMHNEHHEYPRSPFFGSTVWDIGGRFARLFAAMGLLTLHTSARQQRDSDPVPLAS
ncbi:MAG: fatty acid desaturase [Acidimicrobiales bacterium]